MFEYMTVPIKKKIVLFVFILHFFSLFFLQTINMAESKTKAELLPEDVDTDDCLTSYTYIYSPDLLK